MEEKSIGLSWHLTFVWDTASQVIRPDDFSTLLRPFVETQRKEERKKFLLQAMKAYYECTVSIQKGEQSAVHTNDCEQAL